MSVNIDIRGEGVRPTPTTSRMSVYLSDTGSILIYIYIYICIVLINMIMIDVVRINMIVMIHC